MWKLQQCSLPSLSDSIFLFRFVPLSPFLWESLHLLFQGHVCGNFFLIKIRSFVKVMVVKPQLNLVIFGCLSEPRKVVFIMTRRPSLYLPSAFIIFETLPSLLYVLMSRKIFSLHIISVESFMMWHEEKTLCKCYDFSLLTRITISKTSQIKKNQLELSKRL